MPVFTLSNAVQALWQQRLVGGDLPTSCPHCHGEDVRWHVELFDLCTCSMSIVTPYAQKNAICSYRKAGDCWRVERGKPLPVTLRAILRALGKMPTGLR